MKKIIFFCLMLFASTMFATVRTVNNQGGQFIDIESAVVASSPGDTIYIQANGSYYCQPGTIKNNLTFIGSGFNPQKQNPIVTTIGCSRWTFGNYNTAIGIYFAAGIGGNATNLTFKRCRIENGMQVCNSYVSDVTFEDCIFNGFYVIAGNGGCQGGQGVSGANLRNCLIYDAQLFVGLGVSNILVDHCVFYSNTLRDLFGSVGANSTVVFNNTIFFNANATISGGIQQNYTNNFSNTENLNINGGSGNLQGSNPMFVNAPGGGFSFSHDYNLATGSPCGSTGTNGTDMGIYDGASPFIWEGFPPIPQLNFLNILGTQAPQGGSINVTFQSTIKN